MSSTEQSTWLPLMLSVKWSGSQYCVVQPKSMHRLPNRRYIEAAVMDHFLWRRAMRLLDAVPTLRPSVFIALQGGEAEIGPHAVRCTLGFRTHGG